MLCTVFVTISVLLAIFSFFWMVIVFEPYSTAAKAQKIILSIALPIIIAMLACSVYLFNVKAEAMKAELLNSDKKISFSSPGYNTPFIIKKVIIKGGADLTYYEILD